MLIPDNIVIEIKFDYLTIGLVCLGVLLLMTINKKVL
jgi:hypothetical protein